jgi:hypothetical protein
MYGSPYAPAYGSAGVSSYAGSAPTVGYSSAYSPPAVNYAPNATNPAQPTQTNQTAQPGQTPNEAEPNAHPASFQPTGQFYQPPGDSRRYAVYRDVATGRDVYFPNLK